MTLLAVSIQVSVEPFFRTPYSGVAEELSFLTWRITPVAPAGMWAETSTSTQEPVPPGLTLMGVPQ